MSINERGDLSVIYDGELVTPIGTFTLDITPGYGLDEGDVLLEILHARDGVRVKSLFTVSEIGVADVGMTVSGGSGVRSTVDEKKTTIEIPPDAGAQEFTLEADNEELVDVRATTSVTEWTEPEPTTTPPESSETSESEPTSTEPSDTELSDTELSDTDSPGTESPDESVSAELPPIEVTTTT